MSGINLSLYTCGDCGYAETYVKTPVRRWSKPPEANQLEFEWSRRALTRGRSVSRSPRVVLLDLGDDLFDGELRAGEPRGADEHRR